MSLQYLALVGKKSPKLDELCGYYGEKLVLFAQQLGLNTCWAALTYNRRKVREWSDDYLEELAVYRRLADQMPIFGSYLFHGSAVSVDGEAYLFTAPSGTGKSTHTHLWYKYIPGSDLMNDDNPVVRIVDGETRIYGSPWSGKTPCYRNIWAPVGAITRIEQKPVNTIRRMAPVEAFATLLPAVSSMKWDARVYKGICNCISRLLGITPVYLLGCRPDEEAAHVSHDAIAVKSIEN